MGESAQSGVTILLPLTRAFHVWRRRDSMLGAQARAWGDLRRAHGCVERGRYGSRLVAA
jgi:hypothetical protein